MMLFWSAISFTEGCVVLFLLNGFYLMKAAILISHFIYWRLRGYFFTEWFLFNEGSYFDQPFHLLKVAWFFFTEWFLFNEGCYFDQPFHLLKAAWFFYLLKAAILISHFIYWRLLKSAWFFLITEGLLFTEACYFDWCEYANTNTVVCDWSRYNSRMFSNFV